jgi:predicted AAA+ superfamily ATPase
MYSRLVEQTWAKKLESPYVHIIFGARQTGKSTLLSKLVPNAVIRLDFSDPGQRSEYLRHPERLIAECRSLPTKSEPCIVVIDEAQNVPALFDSVQHLYDSDKSRWRFILCGSSARKLRLTGANLLPGRAIVHHLYPLTLAERPFPGLSASDAAGRSPLPFPAIQAKASVKESWWPPVDLVERMAFGELPGLAIAPPDLRADLLRTYCYVYLEEELRREALVKDWGAFARFLKLAASESGQLINYAAVSKEAGVSLPTVKSYYQLLEDMFLGFRVTAFSGSPRKSVLSTERFFFFDLGVRHAAAELAVNESTVLANPGSVFEQFVGIELWKRLQYLGSGKLHYLRTKGGAEVDFIIERDLMLTPIEVKWTGNPSLSDARHLMTFLQEHPRQAAQGYLICRCGRPQALNDRITALPYNCF